MRGIAWAVNISGDGRRVVAAYSDDTIRRHRMDDGRELFAVVPIYRPQELGRLDAAGLLRRHRRGQCRGRLRSALADPAKATEPPSSSFERPSMERKTCDDGAFAEGLPRALGEAAHAHRSGLISSTQLIRLVNEYRRRLIDGAQAPGIELGLDSEVLVGDR